MCGSMADIESPTAEIMCESTVDMQSATAENRRGKRKKKKPQSKNIMACPIP